MKKIDTGWTISILIVHIVCLFSGCAQLTTEYVVVQLEPKNVFSHAGQCPLEVMSDGLQPRDIGVLIEGECHGSKVGDIISLTTGSYEISVDLIGAITQVVDLELTTPENPKVITIEFATGS